MDRTKLLEKATEALKSARRLPVGAERNELRQIAKGLRWMAARNVNARCESSADYLNRVKRNEIVTATANAD